MLTFRHSGLGLIAAVFVFLVIARPASAQVTTVVVVPGASNPWLAGMPNGATASGGDVAPDESPALVTGFTLKGGDLFQFSVTGSVDYSGGTPTDPPDGQFGYDTSHADGAENGISDVTMPVDAMLGVFLGPDPPDPNAVPGALDFTSQASQDYLTLTPAVGQVFFIGDGLTSGNVRQQVVAPSGATRLYLGTMDGFGWFNNTGSFSAQVTDLTAAPVSKVPSLTILHGFDFTSGFNTPYHGVIQGPDGSLYGVTSAGLQGGQYVNSGAVFQIAPDGTFRILHQFSDQNDGYKPSARLLLVGNQLFGTCSAGGAGDLGYDGPGTVFVIDLSKVSPTDNAAGFSVIHYFAASADQADGSNPQGALFLASDGNLYGTTSNSGNSATGTIFQIKPDNSGRFSVTPRTTPSGTDTFNGSYTTIYQVGAGDNAGLIPYAGVVQGPDGFLYGTTQQGGPSSLGTIYKVGTDGQGFTLLHALASDSAGNAPEGAAPQSVPLFASDGNLYGTALYGGQSQFGTVFQIKPDADGVFSIDSPFQVLHDFRFINDPADPAPDGAAPADGLIQATDGNLYGATEAGGAISGVSSGTIFSIASSGGQFSAASPFSTIYSFDLYDNNDTGADRVSGPLIQGSDGRLYGETLQGGPGGAGTVFALDAGLPAPPAVTSVAGSLAPPDATTGDTTLVVHGTNFAAGDTVSIDGVNAPVTSRDYHQADELITVTLASPLRAGAHTVVVADTAPGVRVSNPFAFMVTLLSPQIIQITRGGGGAVTTADTTLIIHGNSFALGDIVSVGNAGGATLTQVILDSGSQFTVTLSQPLPAGHHDVTVTHSAPDGRVSNTYDLEVLAVSPAISAVSGTSNPPVVTTADTTLIVHGTNFSATDAPVFSGTTASATVAGRDLSNPADEQITVTLSQTLAAGHYTAEVPHGTPDTSTPFLFTVVAAPAPTLTSTAYSAQTGQGVLNVSGTGFVRTGTTRITPNDPNVTLGGTLTISFGSSTQLTATFSQPLPAGVYTLTETNPDNKTAQIQVYVLAVTSATYDPQALTVTILGAGFPDNAAVTVGDASNGLVINPLQITNADQIVVNLFGPLPPGPHTFTVTNPDGQAASATLKVIAPVTGLELTVNNSVPVSGVILTPGGAGFSGTANLMQINPDPNSLAGPSAPAAPRSAGRAAPAPPAAGDSPIIDHVKVQTDLGHGDQPADTLVRIEGSNFDASSADYGQTIVTVDGVAGKGVSVHDANTITLFISVITDNKTHSISVTNPDGKTSQTVAFGVVDGNFNKQGQFVPQPTTSYQISIQGSSLVGPGTSIGATAESPLGSSFQKAAIGESDAVKNGASLIGQDGAGIVAAGGGNIVAAGGGNIVSHDAGGIVSHDAGGIVAQGGGNLIGQDGSGIVSHDAGGILVKDDGSHLISQDGAGLQVAGDNVLTGVGASPGAPRSFRTFAPPAAAASNGYMDVTLFVSKAGQGMRLLVTRYTPGERDLILYKDPSVTVTPSSGTPAPVAAITAGVVVTRGPVTRDTHTHQPFQVLTLTNTGAGALSGPFLIGLTGLPAGVTVVAPSGVVAGSPAVAAPGGTLAPGASVQVRVDFTDPTNARFSYGTAVYAGL